MVGGAGGHADSVDAGGGEVVVVGWSGRGRWLSPKSQREGNENGSPRAGRPLIGFGCRPGYRRRLVASKPPTESNTKLHGSGTSEATRNPRTLSSSSALLPPR